jgi:hypothetical protein
MITEEPTVSLYAGTVTTKPIQVVTSAMNFSFSIRPIIPKMKMIVLYAMIVTAIQPEKRSGSKIIHLSLIPSFTD